MRRTTTHTVDKILKDIDGFVEGKQGAGNEGIQTYASIFNPRPFTSGRLKAKLANRVVYIPLKITKKAMDPYFHNKDKESVLIQQKLATIEDRLSYMQECVDSLSEQLLRTEAEKKPPRIQKKS